VADDDLRPHQSTQLERPDYEDGLLNDFGIQHFHLGTAQHPNKPFFVSREDPLLFGLVQDDAFYCIGYYKHGDWSKTELLDIVHAHWPSVISDHTISGIQLGKETLAGTSVKDALDVISARRYCSVLESAVARKVKEAIDAGNLVAPVRLNLRFGDGVSYVDIDGGKGTIDVASYITVPAL